MKAADISVSWGYDVAVTLRLRPRNWRRILAGKPLRIRGTGYYYEGQFFWDYWSFEGGLEGRVHVRYGDGGQGWVGRLCDAGIVEVDL